MLRARSEPHSHSPWGAATEAAAATATATRGLPASSTHPALSRTFLPLNVVPAIQDLLQQGHQGKGADEDEEQSSVPQQIPVSRGVRVAHPGYRAPRARGTGRPGNDSRGSGAPRGARPTWRLTVRSDRRGTSRGKVSGWRGRSWGHPSVAGAAAASRTGRVAGSSAAARGLPHPRVPLPPGARAVAADFPAEGRRQVPRAGGGPSRRGGGQWGARPGLRPLCAPARRAPPPLVRLRIAVAQRAVPCRGRATFDLRARSEGSRRY
ncbi:uncharacterized protein LOC115834037 [Nomascus leucogenys]|uniref:uncharacterized protein LOC115834037 n=1 Tax=Nomascus leucogenys TaxID=61853 RepID=UPI00122D5442|nr:uncharacterized protein LOC115834037 [Nomascus leucogenys]